MRTVARREVNWFGMLVPIRNEDLAQMREGAVRRYLVYRCYDTSLPAGAIIGLLQRGNPQRVVAVGRLARARPWTDLEDLRIPIGRRRVVALPRLNWRDDLVQPHVHEGRSSPPRCVLELSDVRHLRSPYPAHKIRDYRGGSGVGLRLDFEQAKRLASTAGLRLDVDDHQSAIEATWERRSDPAVDDLEADDLEAGRVRSGEERRLIEKRAVQVAKEAYFRRFKQRPVFETGGNERPYDLEFDIAGESRYVEVKGTVAARRTAIDITANEYNSAKASRTDLIVIAGIKLGADRKTASGGCIQLWLGPWTPDRRRAKVVAYRYNVGDLNSTLSR